MRTDWHEMALGVRFVRWDEYWQIFLELGPTGFYLDIPRRKTKWAS